MQRITVKFLYHHSPYIKGETATFFEREANRLIDRGIAMYAAGDRSREDTAAKLRAIRGESVETRHVPGPENTQAVEGPGEAVSTQEVPEVGQAPQTPSKVEGNTKNRASRGPSTNKSPRKPRKRASRKK